MVPVSVSSTRRNFLAGSASFGAFAGVVSIAGPDAHARSISAPVPSAFGQTAGTPAPPKQAPHMVQMAPPYDKATINLIGPKSGFSPQVGTIVTMLTWMELAVLRPTRDLKQQDLDFLFDKNANTIGALMLHLAATESAQGTAARRHSAKEAQAAIPRHQTKEELRRTWARVASPLCASFSEGTRLSFGRGA